jgi:hypothetical protein
VVPLHGRTDELDELERWCLALAAPALHLITRAGGAGETRLAIELCRRMEARGWLTGFLSETAQGEALDRVHELGEPALLVVDYAETRGSESLADLIERLAVIRVDEPRLRLLLIARGAGDWWQTELPARLANPDVALAGVTLRALGPVAPRAGERETAYRPRPEPSWPHRAGRRPRSSSPAWTGWSSTSRCTCTWPLWTLWARPQTAAQAWRPGAGNPRWPRSCAARVGTGSGAQPLAGSATRSACCGARWPSPRCSEPGTRARPPRC